MRGTGQGGPQFFPVQSGRRILRHLGASRQIGRSHRQPLSHTHTGMCIYIYIYIVRCMYFELVTYTFILQSTWFGSRVTLHHADSLCQYIYIYIYTCILYYIYIYMYVYMYICVYVYICMCVYIYIYIYILFCMHLSGAPVDAADPGPVLPFGAAYEKHMCIYIYIYIHLSIYLSLSLYIYIDIHTY